MKKLLKITGISLLCLILLAFIIPFLFKGRIVTLVKKEVNKNINAKADFKDVGISFFRHFPKVSIKLNDIFIAGKGEFVQDTLIAAKGLDVAVNLLSFFPGGDIKIYSVVIESPRIHALVNKEGRANWDIAKSDTTSAGSDTASAFSVKLNHYTIENGYIFYRDESSNMTAEITGLYHTGSGDFTQDEFLLSTDTKTATASFMYDNIPYLVNTKTDILADIAVNLKTNTYTFKKSDVFLNNLKLTTKGFFQLVNDSTFQMDISFNAPSTEFKELLSLIPSLYRKDFDKLKTSGKALFNGFVKGTYSPVQMPAYDINLEIKDGTFQYPDLPKPVQNIQLSLKATNPDGLPDHAVLDISRGHIEMGNEPFDFHILFKNPETTKYIDAVAKGKVDLSRVSEFMKLENGTQLAGIVWADAFVKGNLSAIEQHQGAFTAGGFLDIKNLFYSSKHFPQPIRNGNMKVQIENTGGVVDYTFIDISSGHIEVGKDPVDFTLQLRKPVTTAEFAGSARGRFNLSNIKQFTTLEAGTAISGLLNADMRFSGNKTAIDKSEYEKISARGTATLTNVKFVSTDYPKGVILSRSQLTFDQPKVTINTLQGSYMNSAFTATGFLNNVVGYTMKNEVLKGNVNLAVDKMNLNDWIETDTSTAGTAATTDPFLVPANLDLILNARAGQVKYDKVNYSNVRGTLVLTNETVNLQQVQTDALDGSIIFNGSYSTRVNKKEPDIALSYTVKNVDVQKAFYAYNTIQKLMPIGQFLAGKLSSELAMKGSLTGNMMPDFSSLTGKGNLLLIEGVLKKFQPLEKIANTLNIEELKEITLKDIKNYIEFANGKVLVKPFTVKVKDIEMQIGGLHGFDQSIDYIVQMKLPRKYLGTQGNAIVNNLAEKAINKGIPVNLRETINLSIKLAGSILNPLITTDLKEVAGDAAKELKEKAVDFARQKVDSVKHTLKDSLNLVRKQVTNDLKEELKKQVFGNKDSSGNKPIDSSRKKAGETLKNTVDGLFKRKKKAAIDSTKL